MLLLLLLRRIVLWRPVCVVLRFVTSARNDTRFTCARNQLANGPACHRLGHSVFPRHRIPSLRLITNRRELDSRAFYNNNRLLGNGHYEYNRHFLYFTCHE